MSPEVVRAALSIGAVGGGPGSDSAWTDAVTRLGLRVIEARAGVETPLSLNVVFHIPGRFFEPEFGGLRTGRFSRRDSKLMIQAALPASASSDADAHVRQVLRDAVDLAETFAQEKGLAVGRLVATRALLGAVG